MKLIYLQSWKKTKQKVKNTPISSMEMRMRVAQWK